MTARTVWLASYPKSGNTWVRAVFTALRSRPHLFGVDRLEGSFLPADVTLGMQVFGLDSRWLEYDENARLRHALSLWANESASGGTEPTPPLLRKTHEVFRPGQPGREPFPVVASRAAILVARDPRDVACSFAPFFGISLDKAVEALRHVPPTSGGSPATCRTADPWGSWSSHARSWLSPDVPFPVHVLRFEDLVVDAVAALAPVFAAIGLDCDRTTLEAAVDLARFEKLQQSENDRGYRETSPRTRSFFRRGQSGVWHDDLNEKQVAAIEADHAAVMVELGYELTTDSASRMALAEARASQRRALAESRDAATTSIP